MYSKCYTCIHGEVCRYKHTLNKCVYYVKDYNVKESCCVSCIHKDVCKHCAMYDKNGIINCNRWKGETTTVKGLTHTGLSRGDGYIGTREAGHPDCGGGGGGSGWEEYHYD